MGCSLQKSDKQALSGKRYSTNQNTCNKLFRLDIVTPDKKNSIDVFNPSLGKVVQVPILMPAAKNNIALKRNTQLTIGQ